MEIMENLCPNKNKRVRFTPQEDLIFLREVLSINPLEDRGRWVTLQEVFNDKTRKVFTIRALREHLELLLKKFVIKDGKNKTMTGIEEPYNEMDHLLQQIKEIMKEIEINGLKKSLTQNTSSFFAKDSIEKGKMMRKNLLEQFKENEVSELQLDVTAEIHNGATSNNENIEKDLAIDSRSSDSEKNIISESHNGIPKRTLSANKIRNKNQTVLTPNKSRTPKRLKNSALEFLQIKNDKDNFIKNKELELDEKRLQLEEKRIQIEEKKLAHQIDMDKKKLELEAIKVKMEQSDRNKLHEIIENYQRQTDLLLKKMNT